MGASERTDVEALRVTREESRTVLDHQIALQKDIDDEALRTVRLSLVLVALAVSVVRLMGSTRIGEIVLVRFFLPLPVSFSCLWPSSSRSACT